MDFEIEFHPVGDGTRAGDAITVRYRDNNVYRIMVIDGGTEESGELVVKHIQTAYGADSVVDDVICTHPDSDHASGLRSILREIPVRRLWLHGVWHHAEEMLPMFNDKRWTAAGLSNAIRKEYPIIEELIDLAAERDVEVYEPFAGQEIGPFQVLSPTKYAYLHLVPQFRKTPEVDADEMQRRGMWLNPQKGIVAGLVQAAKAVVANLIPESWNVEKLQEGGVTAAENESSTVLYGTFGDTGVLLTGDAGVNALRWACDHADNAGIPIYGASLVQVPHHGSRRNVSPSVLNRLLGPPLPAGAAEKRKAIVSVPKDDENHPRKIVLNAFLRRGAGVRKTQGSSYRFHSGNMPERPKEVKASVFGFFDKVESYD